MSMRPGAQLTTAGTAVSCPPAGCQLDHALSIQEGVIGDGDCELIDACVFEAGRPPNAAVGSDGTAKTSAGVATASANAARAAPQSKLRELGPRPANWVAIAPINVACSQLDWARFHPLAAMLFGAMAAEW